MHKRFKRILALSLVVVTLGAPLPGHAAGWVDDWISQRTYNPPNYLQGSQRGYYSAGSFSSRWPSSADYPVTIEMPRMRSGCGGIDMFLGGFSFMDFDYLVQKFSNIVGGAAQAALFDLALKTLCEPCASTMKSVEALANQLNSMQIDECSAVQGVRAFLDDGSGGFASMETMSGRLTTSLKENKLSQGFSNLYQSITESDRANQHVPQPTDVAQAVSACNADLKTTFLSDLSGADTLLLHNIGVEKMGLQEEYVNLIRGLVGDVRIAAQAQAFRVTYVSPCPDNNPDDVAAFIDGMVMAKSRDTLSCYQLNDANRDLVDYIQSQMLAVSGKIKSKTPPGPTELAFLESNPLSLGLTLRSAVATGREETVIAVMSELTAKAYVVMMLSDLYSRGGHILEKAKEMLAKKSVAQPGHDAENCMAEIFAENVDAQLSGMLDRINRLRYSARISYNGAVEEVNAILQLMRDQEQVENKLRAEISQRYGQDVARRVTGIN
ncbi:conjugal transfer protein TraH [Desulfurivibrio sp. D14AmB]|uniref:conjugal transfer protein TraH n=1 Tax=Desulfurivibrio sp. D14AmB TaxID=3374370 RepID=UPI00376F157A